MKYIRTIDGVIFAGPIDNKGTYKCTNLGLWKEVKPIWENNEIIKEADTIEELCDEFVIYDSGENNGLPITCPKERFTEIKPYIQIGMQKQFSCWLKGAIWTDKGLIYVAKMNEKGELELI